MPEKPRGRSGYSREELEQVRAALLTVAVTLGEYLDELCIVGGLVPSLLIDAHRPEDEASPFHPGTNDLDVGLALALLDDERYAEISKRLRAEGFHSDINEKGNPAVQRWKLGELKVTVDFLLPPTEQQPLGMRIQKLESDFGAVITPGLELAFSERVQVELAGHTLKGEPARRTVPVCGPAAYTVLKALAFAGRGEPKDAFDLVYVLEHAEGGVPVVAARLAAHAEQHPEVVERALGILARDFGSPDAIGPLRAAEFSEVDAGAREDAAADAHGFVDDLLRALSARSPEN